VFGVRPAFFAPRRKPGLRLARRVTWPRGAEQVEGGQPHLRPVRPLLDEQLGRELGTELTSLHVLLIDVVFPSASKVALTRRPL
jgi:hypothetical protein